MRDGEGAIPPAAGEIRAKALGGCRRLASPCDCELPDHPVEECAVFGMYDEAGGVAHGAYFGLMALQHRGQESAGIAVADGRDITLRKACGLVADVFSRTDLAKLAGKAAIGHCRYSTSGDAASVEAAHPYLVQVGSTRIALAHNGTLVNTPRLLERLAAAGLDVSPHTDSEAAAYLVALEADRAGSVEEGIRAAMRVIRGAYAMVVLSAEGLYAFRDPHGIRPLAMGRTADGGWAVASETCGLDIVGARDARDVGPGQIVRIDRDGAHPLEGVPAEGRATCVFEYVYFARPDSVIDGRTVYQARLSMGRVLAAEAPADADLVLGVPDSGIPPALGYSQESGIPFADGIVKNRYTYRTFIQPTQALRKQGIRLKLNPLPSVIAGRRLVVIDDSIVRGNTARELVAMLRDEGAREVHLRITSPEVKWPCFYGIDTAARGQLLSSSMDVDEACRWIGADSLRFISLEGLRAAVMGEGAHVGPTSDSCRHQGFCEACFTGEYPSGVPQARANLPAGA